MFSFRFFGRASGNDGEQGANPIRRPSMDEGDDDLPSTLSSIDRELIHRLRNDDHNALAELYAQHYPSLHRFITSLLRSPDDASEIVSDLFVTVWERRHDLVVRTTIAAYLFSAAKNRARNFLRDTRTRQHLEEQIIAHDITTASPSRADDELERSNLVAAALRVLQTFPDPGRTAALLRWTAGRSYPEIGAILGISAGAAQVHVSRVLKGLRAILPGMTE